MLNQGKDSTTWYNQQLFFHKDFSYSTESMIEVKLTLNHEHSMDNTLESNFNGVFFNIQVFNHTIGKNFNCFLKYIEIVDLLSSIDKTMNNIDSIYDGTNGNNIILKNYKNKALKLCFKQSSSSGDKCVFLAVIYEPTNYGLIILPLNVFISLTNLMRQFERDYINICLRFNKIMLMSNLLKSNLEIQRSTSLLMNHSISSSINNNISSGINNSMTNPAKSYDKTYDYHDNTVILNEDIKKNKDGASNGQSEFDTFLSENIDSIDSIMIPEHINHEVKKNDSDNTHSSKLLEGTFSNSILKVENFLTVLTSKTDHPIVNILKSFGESITLSDVDGEDEKNIRDMFLPGITDVEYKSLLYVTRRVYEQNFKLLMKERKGLTSSVSITTYNINDKSLIKSENIEIAYDILILSSFLKLSNDRLAQYDNDNISNKALLNFTMRVYMDVFCYPVLLSLYNSSDIKQLINVVTSRFSSFERSGFFESYQDMLVSFGLKEITVDDMRGYVSMVLPKVFTGKRKSVTDLHQYLYDSGNSVLPVKNEVGAGEHNYVSEIVKLEIKQIFEERFDLNEIKSEKVRRFFLTKDERDRGKDNDVNELTVERFIRNNISEVPARLQSYFMNKIKGLNDCGYDFKDETICLSELGDNVLKTLYVWQPGEDKKLKSNYTYLCERINNVCMNRDALLISLRQRGEEEEDKKSNDWLSGIELNLS